MVVVVAKGGSYGRRETLGERNRGITNRIGLHSATSALLPPPIPDWDIIFSKTRNPDKYGNYTSSLFQAPIASRSRSFLRRLASPRPYPPHSPVPSAVLIVFEGMEKHRPRGRNTLIYRCTAIHPRSDYNEGN